MSSLALSNTRPSRIVAGLISLVAPGVGHIYAGHGRRGVLIVALLLIAQPILAAVAYFFVAPTFWALCILAAAGVAVLGLIYLFALIDAVRLARRGPGQRWYVWCGAIALMWLTWYLVGLGAPVLKARMPWQTYSVVSTSMQPTLRIGEWLIADKAYFDDHAPARDDLVVYRLPADNSTIYIKRIVGLGGDRVAFRNGHVLVNGVMATEPFADFGDPNAFYANTAEVTVPAGHVFVAGDNRANSSDSRVRQHGMVPVKNLVGRATEIFMTDDLQRAGLWVGSPK
jgi:signal peptidase I